MKNSSKSDSWIGRLIGDRQRYRLDERLGAGGMGDVFLTMDTLLGQQVALKLLKDNLANSSELRKRFEREVAVCAALRSDHIVQVSDYGVTAEGYPFFVMEYLRGQSLGQLLRRENRLSVERIITITTQVCDGLRAAHEGVTLWRNNATVSEHITVVHRDLKPDNIFLVPTTLGELVKILDFGIAKIREDTAEHTKLTNMFLGTYHYAAPEQLEVKANIDGRADIYSLGIILYEMLSGVDPFGLGLNSQKISEISWALAHTSKPPVPLRSLPGLSQISPEIEAVVMRCLQKSPDERFNNVEELKQALQNAVSQLSINDFTIAQNFQTYTQGSDDQTIARPSPFQKISTEKTVRRSPNFSLSSDDKTVRRSANLLPNLDDETIQQPFFEQPNIEDGTIQQPLPSAADFEDATVRRPLKPVEQSIPEEILSLEQETISDILAEVIGPIANTLIREVTVRSPNTQELLENLMLYLSAKQRNEFEQKAILWSQKSSSNTQSWSNHPYVLNNSVINTSFLRQCEESLSEIIGPIAGSLIQAALTSHPQISHKELVIILAKEISDKKQADNFYQQMLK
ncbi:serine/threonine protein kinase [Nostoc sp. FACHB-152]|uniref:serine/threonine protein kinase n=1 Tax=unclassified Nostoc TaxID=2593658 RepID=UPI001688C3F0|nr:MULTISPECIES: serine/threonine-protein kinase [unclassified Nostoc]MBD2449748.1 serine/threonine protein kinase [Nostoc sp. FACHB-152]MBD2469875.1 serine/threonine protein kinase [Nostoc sp. FACHB-145]